jgi:hypothetical protein
MESDENYMNHIIGIQPINYTELDPEGIMADLANQNPSVEETLDEMKRLKAEKRLNAGLRKMEREQKAHLLAEAQHKMGEARRTSESREGGNNEELAPFPSPVEDMFRAQKVREDLLAMEREQMERLLQETLEMQGRLLGEKWPAARDPLEAARFDHIPKPDPLYKRFIEEAFPGYHSARLEGSNE